MTDLQRQIDDLETMRVAELRAQWREVWRKPAPSLGPDLLRRGIAWKMQSRIHGDLAPHIRREIETVQAALRDGKELASRPRRLKPGTRLVREWHGTIHQVVVLDQGFEHDGRHYASLTQVATAIAGVHWSGPAFFGLKRRAVPVRP